jgi:hypothetical protein
MTLHKKFVIPPVAPVPASRAARSGGICSSLNCHPMPIEAASSPLSSRAQSRDLQLQRCVPLRKRVNSATNLRVSTAEYASEKRFRRIMRIPPMKTAATESPGAAVFPRVLGSLLQFLHAASNEHRISAYRILQNETHHAESNCRVAAKVT